MFADLGYTDAEERQTKLWLAHGLNRIIARRRLTQAAAAERLGINQPKGSALSNCKLEGFSVERLMTFLTALDRGVESRACEGRVCLTRDRSWRRSRTH